jgi:hypothetical protein
MNKRSKPSKPSSDKITYKKDQNFLLFLEQLLNKKQLFFLFYFFGGSGV